MSSTTEFTEQQLASARAKVWRQDGKAILTLEAARTWLTDNGLVLFAARPKELPGPAASFVEATLGAPNANPTVEAVATARSLVARMVEEGSALPLNLLGTATDTPDFVVSAQVFSYIFTLRGDKAWKQPPSTSAAIKVSPLGLRVYETLTERGAMTAAEIALELGREVTEAAIMRALVELWSQLRVVPLLKPDPAATLWELASKRFTKAIKAGANAGQPTALSALVSLYLAQAVAATEDEIETYLSPLTARSRLREVLHALTGARQLETVVLEGKTLLHVPGSLPEFAVENEALAVDGVEVAAGADVEFAAPPKPKKIGTGRIGKFASEGKTAGALRGKPTARPGARLKVGGAKPTSRFGPRLDGKSDPERRPFKKAGAAKPTFTKPWDEDRKAKPAGDAGPEAFKKFRKPEPEERAPLGPREKAGLPQEMRTPPKSSFDRAPKTGGFVKRPYAARGEGASRPFAKKPFAARSGDAKPRTFSKPGFGSKPGGGFGAKKPYAARGAEGGERPFAKRPYAPRSAEGGERSFSKPKFGGAAKAGGFAAKRPYTPRSEGGAAGFAKRPYTPRTAEGGDRPAAKRPYTPLGAEGGERSFSRPKFGGAARVGATRPGGFGAKRPYTPRDEGGSAGFAKRPYAPRTTEGGERPAAKRPYTPRSAEGGERSFSKPKFDRAPRAGGFKKRESTPLPSHDGERSFPKRPYKPRAADADQRKFTKAPWVPEPGEGAGKKRAFKSREGGPRKFGAKKFGAGGFAGKRKGPAAGGAPKPEAGE